MDSKQLHSYLESRFDKVENKLDTYTERLVRVEEQQKSMSGYIKVALSAVLAIATSVITYVINSIIKK